jgi:hypothetical protein
MSLNQELLDVVLQNEIFQEIALNKDEQYVQELVRTIELDIQNTIVSRLVNIQTDLIDSF